MRIKKLLVIALAALMIAAAARTAQKTAERAVRRGRPRHPPLLIRVLRLKTKAMQLRIPRAAQRTMKAARKKTTKAA